MSDVRALNDELAQCAKLKALTEARRCFSQRSCTANEYTYSILVNCNVRTGDIPGAKAVLAEMRAAGWTPSVVCYTTLLKGLCQSFNLSDLEDAEALLAEMEEACVLPNIRTANTFLRGCLQHGAVQKGAKCWAKMHSSWNIEPDASSMEYIVALLCQALRLGEAEEAVGTEASAAADLHLSRAAALLGEGVQAETHAMRALRALQLDEKAAIAGDDVDKRDPGSAPAASGGKRAWRPKNADTAARETSRAVFTANRRSTLRREADLVCAFVTAHLPRATDGVERGSAAVLSTFECLLRRYERLVVFTAATPQHGGKLNDEGRDKLGAALVSALCDSFGLREVLRRRARALGPSSAAAAATASAEHHGSCDAGAVKAAAPGRHAKRRARKRRLQAARAAEEALLAALRRRFASCAAVDRTSECRGFVDFRRLMDTAHVAAATAPPLAPLEQRDAQEDPSAVLPLKMEVCSGTGEWVSAQASADAGRALWVSLEVRLDRVYSGWSRHYLGGVGDGHEDNLCFVAGDAATVVPERLPLGAFSRVFVNYPEPPQQGGGHSAAAGGGSFEGQHLLTEGFLRQLSAALVPGSGTLTILTDNLWYARVLQRILSALVRSGELLSAPVRRGGDASHEPRGQGCVVLHDGLPGPECGCGVSGAESYFSRLKRGETSSKSRREGRWFLHVVATRVGAAAVAGGKSPGGLPATTEVSNRRKKKKRKRKTFAA